MRFLRTNHLAQRDWRNGKLDLPTINSRKISICLNHVSFNRDTKLFMTSKLPRRSKRIGMSNRMKWSPSLYPRIYHSIQRAQQCQRPQWNHRPSSQMLLYRLSLHKTMMTAKMIGWTGTKKENRRTVWTRNISSIQVYIVWVRLDTSMSTFIYSPAMARTFCSYSSVAKRTWKYRFFLFFRCHSRSSKQIIFSGDTTANPIVLQWYHGDILQLVYFNVLKSFVAITDETDSNIYTIDVTHQSRLKIRLRTCLPKHSSVILKDRLFLRTDECHLFVYYERENRQKRLRLFSPTLECVRSYSIGHCLERAMSTLQGNTGSVVGLAVNQTQVRESFQYVLPVELFHWIRRLFYLSDQWPAAVKLPPPSPSRWTEHVCWSLVNPKCLSSTDSI